MMVGGCERSGGGGGGCVTFNNYRNHPPIMNLVDELIHSLLTPHTTQKYRKVQRMQECLSLDTPLLRVHPS